MSTIIKDAEHLAAAIDTIKVGSTYDGSWAYVYTIRTKVQGDGTASGGGTYISGETATINCQHSTDFSLFNGWYKGSTRVSGDYSYSFSVSESTTLTAKFSSIVVGAGGTVSISGDRRVGQSITLTATPDSSHIIDEWLVNGTRVSTSASITRTLGENDTIEIKFMSKQVSVEVTGTSSAYATVDGTQGARTFTKNMGESISLYVKSDDGTNAPATITVNSEQKYSGAEGTVAFTIPTRCTAVVINVTESSKEVSKSTKKYGVITLTSQVKS